MLRDIGVSYPQTPVNTIHSPRQTKITILLTQEIISNIMRSPKVRYNKVKENKSIGI